MDGHVCSNCTAEARSLVDCHLMDLLWGCNFLPKNNVLLLLQSNPFFFSEFALDWGGIDGFGRKRADHGWAGCFVCNIFSFLVALGQSQPTLFSTRFFSFHFLLRHVTSRRNWIAQSNRTKQKASYLSSGWRGQAGTLKLARIWLISLQGSRLEQSLAASKANESAMCIDGVTNGRAISRQIVVEMVKWMKLTAFLCLEHESSSFWIAWWLFECCRIRQVPR